MIPNFNDCIEKYNADFVEIQNYSESVYDEYFSADFSIIHDFYAKLANKTKPISDEELSSILLDVPLRLFNVSENLSHIKTRISILKIDNRKNKDSEDISGEILLRIFESIAERVEHEMSFSRELIMGAKKIWDSRRNAEKSNPVSEVEELPEFTLKVNKSYIG